MRFSSTLSVGKTRRPCGTRPMPLRTVSKDGIRGDVLALEHDLAAARRIEADDRVHQRGLAHAVAPEQAEDLALLELQATGPAGRRRRRSRCGCPELPESPWINRSPDRFPGPSRCGGSAPVAPVSSTSPKCSTEICVGHVEHHVHVVLDQQDREIRIEPHEELRHLGRLARGQPGRRLIQQQDLRVAGETEHDLELALLAVREVANLGVLAVHEGGRSSRSCALS